MEQINLSVIVAAYNVEGYIESCLLSLLVSTPFKKEVIVINDGSTDSSPFIIASIAQVHPELIIINQPNQGLSAVRNRGIKEARGNYLLFVDGDDFVNLQSLETALSQTTVNEVDIVAMPHFDLYPSGEELFGDAADLQNRGISKGADLLSNIFSQKKYCSAVWSYLWHRPFLLQNELFFTPNLLHEDVPFTYIAFFRAKACCYLNYPIYFYRRDRPGSITNIFNPRRLISVAQFLPTMEQALLSSSSPHDKHLKTHLAAVAFKILHLISLQKDSASYISLFKQLNFPYYIKKYSCTGRYRMASVAFTILGYSLYGYCYRFFQIFKNS